MLYELRHFDTTLLRFAASEESGELDVEIVWRNAARRELFPLDLDVSASGVAKWLKRRTIPRNRAYVHSLLSKCGLNLNRPLNIIRVSKGLSLNDRYWVVEEGFNGTFADCNLYDNRFGRILSLVAFTGYGSSVRTSPASCPEFTTDGMLPKCWRRVGGKIKLYKGGTSGASNTGREPYSEYYAAQVAQALGVDAVSYNLAKWSGELCSVCDSFTDKEFSFLSVGRVVASGGMKAVRECYRNLGPKYLDALNGMIVLDALISNADRHFGNFGFLVRNKTNRIVAPAPLFDHGNSLFNYAGRDDFASEASLGAYAETLVPCVYDDFVGAAQAVLTKGRKAALRKMTSFAFKKHPRHNLPDARLRLIEKKIQNRAMELMRMKTGA